MKALHTLRAIGIQLKDVAAALGTSQSYLSQMLHGRKPWAPKYCIGIESITGGAVTRQDLRPHDALRIWPELRPHKTGDGVS